MNVQQVHLAQPARALTHQEVTRVHVILATDFRATQSRV